MKDCKGKTIEPGQKIKVINRHIDSLVNPGEYRVRSDNDGNLIIITGVAITELPSQSLEVIEG